MEKVVAKLAATRRYRNEFGLHQQQGAVEPKTSIPATVEKAHTIPEQLTTEQQCQQQGPEIPLSAKLAATRHCRNKFGLHQQQGVVEPKNSNPAMVEKAHAIHEQLATKQQCQQQGPEIPGASCTLQWAIRSYARAAERGPFTSGPSSPPLTSSIRVVDRLDFIWCGHDIPLCLETSTHGVLFFCQDVPLQ